MQLGILSLNVAEGRKLVSLPIFNVGLFVLGFFYMQPPDVSKGCLLTLIITLLIALGRLL